MAQGWRQSVHMDFLDVCRDYEDVREDNALWAPRIYAWWRSEAAEYHSVEHPDVPLETLFDAEPNGSDDDSAEDEPEARWHEVPSFLRGKWEQFFYRKKH